MEAEGGGLERTDWAEDFRETWNELRKEMERGVEKKKDCWVC